MRTSEPAQERWAKRVRAWRRSGLTCREFAARAGLNAGTLSVWAWRLKREAGRAGTAGRETDGRATAVRGEFVEVILERESDARFVLELNGGRRLTIPPGFDSAALTRLLAALGDPVD